MEPFKLKGEVVCHGNHIHHKVLRNSKENISIDYNIKTNKSIEEVFYVKYRKIDTDNLPQQIFGLYLLTLTSRILFASMHILAVGWFCSLSTWSECRWWRLQYQLPGISSTGKLIVAYPQWVCNANNHSVCFQLLQHWGHSTLSRDNKNRSMV